jgi:hypothetical protein
MVGNVRRVLIVAIFLVIFAPMTYSQAVRTVTLTWTLGDDCDGECPARWFWIYRGTSSVECGSSVPLSKRVQSSGTDVQVLAPITTYRDSFEDGTGQCWEVTAGNTHLDPPESGHSNRVRLSDIPGPIPPGGLRINTVVK